MPRFKSIIFYYHNPKINLFLQKNAKFSSAGGSAPRTPCLRRLGALLPDPQLPAAGGFAHRLPLASGGWGLRPQTPIIAPIANFWLGVCLKNYAKTTRRPDFFRPQFSAFGTLRLSRFSVQKIW